MKNTLVRVRVFFQRRQLVFLPAILVGTCLIATGFYADYLHSQNMDRELRDSVFTRSSLLRADLEGKITSNAQLVQGLVASISAEPDLSTEKFAKLAQYLFNDQSELRNIGAAPDMVIRYLYPIKGNESAIGLNFREHPQQLESVLRARDSGNLIIAGPVDLVQGGQGFIARIPVFFDDTGGNKRVFWGMISAVIDVNQLYQTSGLLDLAEKINISIRGKDALGKAGEVFFGNEQIFEQNPVLLDISLPNGSWQMAAAPKEGWGVVGNDRAIFRFGLILIGI